MKCTLRLFGDIAKFTQRWWRMREIKIDNGVQIITLSIDTPKELVDKIKIWSKVKEDR
jgi:hypothetical protein